MSYSVTTLDGERKPRRLPGRELDPIEVRILGCLMEKQLATPEYYPLTINALIAACNQKSNREPVMEVGESDIQRALDRLQDEKLVWKVLGGRATRWDHNLDLTWHLDRPAKAILAHPSCVARRRRASCAGAVTGFTVSRPSVTSKRCWSDSGT